jgi:hypothetical protein
VHRYWYKPGVGDKLLLLQLTAVINWAGKSLKKEINNWASPFKVLIRGSLKNACYLSDYQ